MSDVPVTVDRIKISDIEDLRDSVQDGPLKVVQLQRGKMAGVMLYLAMGPISFSTASFSLGVRGRGVQSERSWSLGMVTKPALIQGFEMRPGDLFLLAPGQEIYTSFSSANSSAIMYMEPDALFAYLDSQRSGASEAAVWRQPTSLLPADPATAAARVGTLRTLLAAISSEGTPMSAGTVEFYRRCILDLMTQPVLASTSYDREPRLGAVARAELVRKVERYLVDAGTKPVHITELIEKFKVSEHRLFRAFKSELGIGPITFLRHKRLGDVHAALLGLQGGSDLWIKDIAREHGFPDHTNFDDAYQKLFGEKPSHTLRRGRR